MAYPVYQLLSASTTLNKAERESLKELKRNYEADDYSIDNAKKAYKIYFSKLYSNTEYKFKFSDRELDYLI